MSRRPLSIVLALSLALAPTPALAAKDDGGVTIVLKSGAKYRGTLVEEVPGDHVTIQLATGEVKRFEWADVVHKAPKPSAGTADEEPEDDDTPEPPKSKPKTSPAPEPDEPGGPYVHITTKTEGVVLERLTGQSDVDGGGLSVSHWRIACRAPCDTEVRAGDGYRLSGKGLRSTKTFSLEGSGSVKIDAQLGSKGAFYAGVAIGATGAGLGAVSLLIASTARPTEICKGGFSSSCEQDTSLKDTMLVFAGMGLVISVVGFVIAGINRNEVTVDGNEIARRKSPTIALTPAGLVF